MSAERRVTEREAVLRERKAFVEGARRICVAANSGIIRMFDHERDAAEIYPLPTITRPRVVRDPHGIDIRWTVRSRQVVAYDSDQFPCAVGVTPERVKLWADLLANPTEEVPDDGFEGISDA